MPAVNLDELEQAAIMVDDGEGETRALVARDTGIVHLLNDEYMDEEAPLPSDADTDDAYVVVPPASTLGIGDQLVFRFAAGHMAGDQHTIRALFDADDADGFEQLLEARGASETWERFRTDETHAVLRRWCEEHGLQVAD